MHANILPALMLAHVAAMFATFVGTELVLNKRARNNHAASEAHGCEGR